MKGFAISVSAEFKSVKRLIGWQKIKNFIIGKGYDLSVVLLGEKEMRRAEKISRHKKRANVLAFAYGKKSGEILLNIQRIRREAKKLAKPFKKRLAYLYIHSLLHLRGCGHKKLKDELAMMKKEEEMLRRFLK